jgi:formaldehyde-activating enzyme involved in methanogenesis
MKTVISMIAVLALGCFTTMIFAADAAASAASAHAKADVIIGKIIKIDTTGKTIVVKDKTITVKAEDMAKLKKSAWVKVTLATGTMNADKVEIIKAKTYRPYHR